MHSLENAVNRLWRRLITAGHRRVVPVVVSVVAVTGAVTGTVLATVSGPPGPGPASAPHAAPASGSQAALAGPAASATPVVPLLGGSADARGASVRVPVAQAPAGPAPQPVAALRGLREADLLVIAPFSLPAGVLATVARQPEVTAAEPVEAARVKINGEFTAVLGVNPSTFRGYAAAPTAKSNPLWQGVADGGMAVSYTMGKLDRLALGGQVTVAGQRREQLPVVAFGTMGIGGVDAVVSDSVASSLGMPARNAIVVSAPPASVTSLAARIKRALPPGASVEPLITQVTRPSMAGLVPGSAAAATGGAVPSGQLLTALRAAEGKRGTPYQWGAAGPAAFDCSGLVQWSFAQAGIVMPRVAADQARTGPAVPVSALQAGDLLFYHTDPTAPGYISHVAIYLGSGWMIQAPQPGMTVEIVPASFGSEFAGAVRVYPAIAARTAAGLA